MADKDPRWHRYVALACGLGLIAAAVIFRARLKADFIPVDGGRVSPNILAQAITDAFLLFVLSLLWPPWRRIVHRFFDRKLGVIHSKLDVLRASHEDLHEKIGALDARHDRHEANHEALMSRLDRLEKRFRGVE